MTPSSSVPRRYGEASTGPAVSSPISGASGAYPLTAPRKSRHTGCAGVLHGLVPDRVQDRRDVTVERRTARARAGPAVVVARVAVPEPVGEDLVDDRPLQPGRRRERAVVDGQVEGVEWLPGRFPRPAFVDVRAAVVVAVPVDAARRLDAERVGDEGRLCRGPVR